MTPMKTAPTGFNPGFSAGFFSHHGWLAPGVKLFRGLSFPAKSACILTVLLIPIASMLYLLYRADMELINTTRLERQGVTYVAEVTGLAKELAEFRHVAVTNGPNLSEKKAAVSTALERVQKKQQELGTVFGGETNQDFEKLKGGLASVLQQPVLASPDETFATHTNVVDLALGLLGSIGDGSQLALDPELDTYHMMNLVVVEGPQYAEYLARLRALGTATLISGGSPAPERRMQALQRNLTLIDYVDPVYENSYRKGIESFPEVAGKMNMKEVDSTRETLLAALNKQILIASPAGDPQAFQNMASAAVNQQQLLDEQILKRLDSQLQARIDRLNSRIMLEFSACLLGVALALYLFLSFYVVIKGGLALVSEHLNELAEGDLRNRPTKPWGSDEPAMLILDLHKVYDSMHDLISRVRHSARELANTSTEVSRASLDLSSRTEEAASNLGEQASAVEQIGSQVRETAARTQSAASAAQENSKVAAEGGRIISEVVVTMGDINNASTRISDIIGTIDGIAFQTNILALNAAVEAARAGESGRGFAVVASEVRSLAGRSAEAAREIKTLISASVDRINAGTQIVQGAGKTMSEMVTNASQINQLLEEISMATAEQSKGVDEVVKAIHQLDVHTQQNAALVEETSAAAASLSEQAENLTGEIARFKVT